MIYTISDLQAGRVAVVNDGTVEQLTEVLKTVFGKEQTPMGIHRYYFASDMKGFWGCSDEAPDLPTQSAPLFSLREEPQERVEISWESVFDNAQSMHMVEFINNMRELYNISKK